MAYPVLRIQLLGDFQLLYNHTPVKGVRPARLQSILAYIILHANAPQSRQQVAFLLWPDSSESNARNNLRQFLHQLRQVLPTAQRFLETDANTIYWKTDDEQLIDTEFFTQTLQAADEAEACGDLVGLRLMLERAIAAYQGDLLPSCYDDWIAPIRERLHLQCQRAAQKLLQLLETQRDYLAAIEVAQQLLQFDPLDEEGYVTLVRLHGLQEDHAAARRVYQSAVTILRRELDVEPSDRLRATYERLQRTPPRLLPFNPAATFTSVYPLIGRTVEWQALQRCWQNATAGKAHLSLIYGEAGIGKSRLAEELFNSLLQQGVAVAYTRSYGAEGPMSLAPVTEWLRSNALRPQLAMLDPIWLTEIARLLPELLTEHPTLSRPEPITEYGRRQRFFEALARGLLAALSPLLLWIDDLQWCDQETLEWLHFLLRFAPNQPLLILGTARSEETPSTHPVSGLMRQLQVEDNVTVLELASLDAAETAKLAQQVQGHTVDVTTTLELYRETAGNPLFVVETVRAVMSGALPALRSEQQMSTFSAVHPLPARVYAIISGRLAQISPAARKVVELGAVVGRAFTVDLLVGTETVDEVTIVQALDELWQRRIVHEQQANLFDFTHDKLRDVAYVEISTPQRRFLHRRVAQALERINRDNRDPVSAQLAAHYEQAGMLTLAVGCFQRAGAAAADVYAIADAIRHYTRGLSLLAQLPPDSDRNAQEFTLQFALGMLFIITHGWAAKEVEETLTRALVLGDNLSDVEQRIKIRRALQSLYVVRANYELVRQFHEESEQLIRDDQQRRWLPDTRNYAIALLFMGQPVASRTLFDQTITNHDEELLVAYYEAHGFDHLATTYAMRSQTLWCLGYPDAARDSLRLAEQFAQKHNRPFDQVFTMAYLAMLQEWSADFAAFRLCAQATLTLTSESHANYYQAWSAILLHFADAWQQPTVENRANLRTAIHALTSTGARVRLPYYFSLLARVQIKAEQWSAADDALTQAFAASQQNNEHWWDAELWRLRGELCRQQQAEGSEVERTYQQALAIAQAQQAKSLELRAALSLAIFWQSRDRLTEAKQLLTPIYGWFTEGFDTIDLQNARAFLAQG